MENIPETVTTMRVHLNNTQQISQTPQDIARKIKNRFDNRRNLQSFNTNKNTNDQGTSTNIHSYEHNRLVQTQTRSTTESYISPPLPNYPPPVRPPPPSDYITDQPRTQSYNQQQLFTTNRNKVRRLVQFRCIFRAFQGLKRTKNATKLHQSSYFVT